MPPRWRCQNLLTSRRRKPPHEIRSRDLGIDFRSAATRSVVLDNHTSQRLATFVRFWWVNQNQTYRQETEGGYLWAPKRNRDGGFNAYYEFMREIAPGDLIFSFAYTWIRQVGIAEDYCIESPQPVEFGHAGRAWNNIGWRVRVRFFALDNPIRPKDHIVAIAALLPARYAPLRVDGGGNQIYLASIPDQMAHVLGGLIGRQFRELVEIAASVPVDEKSRAVVGDLGTSQWEEHLVEEVTAAPNLTATERKAIIQARVGQGIFRENVFRIEKRCRLTGVSEPTHLRASHSKPWRTSDTAERLNGENGLLLTPTIDHLFDRGFISFEDQGELLISPVANPDSLKRMGVLCDRVVNVGGFTTGQRHFLNYHRDNVFLARHSH